MRKFIVRSFYCYVLRLKCGGEYSLSSKDFPVVSGSANMKIILLAMSASMFEGSEGGVAMYYPECEDITMLRNVRNRSY